jgi:hypothetical protein
MNLTDSLSTDGGFMALWHWQKKLLYLVVDIEIHTTGSSISLDDFLSMQLE